MPPQTYQCKLAKTNISLHSSIKRNVANNVPSDNSRDLTKFEIVKTGTVELNYNQYNVTHIVFKTHIAFSGGLVNNEKLLRERDHTHDSASEMRT